MLHYLGIVKQIQQGERSLVVDNIFTHTHLISLLLHILLSCRFLRLTFTAKQAKFLLKQIWIGTSKQV